MSASGSAGPGLDPKRGSKFSFENFQHRGSEGWRCTLSNRYIVHHSPGLNSKPFRTMYNSTVDSDSSVVKPGGPLGAFREEQAMRRHRVSPYPFLSSSSSHTTQRYTTVTLTATLTSTSSRTLQILIPHVMWSAQAANLKLNAIYPPCVEPEARNSAVGWYWNTQLYKYWQYKLTDMPSCGIK